MAVYAPNANYRSVLKRPDTGWDVWASQVGLNTAAMLTAPAPLVEDGVFGPLTEMRVKALQSALRVTVDGVLGPETQRALCARECDAASAHVTPAGLVKGLCFGESAGIIAATTGRYPDGSRDFGPLQRNLPGSATQADIRPMFDVRLQAAVAAKTLRTAFEALSGLPGVTSERGVWELAVLSWNWPAAARRIARGERLTWEYWEDTVPRKGPYKLDTPAPWVESYRIPGVTTGWEWCLDYVKKKIGFVTSWSV